MTNITKHLSIYDRVRDAFERYPRMNTGMVAEKTGISIVSVRKPLARLQKEGYLVYRDRAYERPRNHPRRG